MSEPHVRAGRIRRALFDIREHYQDTLTPVRRASGSHATAAAFAPMPISANILDVRAMACSRLSGWVLVVLDDQDLHTNFYGTDVVALTGFLDKHADWLAVHEAASDVIAELEASAADLSGIVLDNLPHRFKVGACLAPPTGRPALVWSRPR